MSTARQQQFNASQAAGALLVEHCDIPAELTIGEWRAVCAAERRAADEACEAGRGRLRRVLRRR